MLRTAGLILAAAAAYYISGRLGLLLAIPPGYATAIWPASGIALAAVILAGARVLPGVFLGSFLINIGTGLDTSNVATVLTALPLPAAIAAGAAAQALLGAWLIRRMVGYTNLLAQEQEVVRILLLGGPLACLLNATVGVGGLWLAGKVPSGALPFSWFTWWVGDSIGVLVFTPLVLVWAIRPYRQWLRQQLYVTVPLLLLFCVVVAVFIFISQREQLRIETEFKVAGHDIGRNLREDLNNTLGVLGSLEAFYAGSAQVKPYEFETFATRLLEYLPGALGLSWNPVVEGRAARAARVRVVELDRDGRRVPAGPRDWYVPVQYIVPAAGNEEALGFDMLSEPVRRAAVERARDTGHAAATGRIALVQDAATDGILVFMPVYRDGFRPQTLESRRQHIQGFAAAVFRLSGLMRQAAAQARSKGISLQLYDQTAGESSPVYTLSASDPVDLAGSLQDSQRFEFAGKPWRLDLQLPAQTLMARRSWASWFVLAGGLLLTSLMGVLMLLSVGRTASVEALVKARTRELKQLNTDLGLEVSLRRRLENEAGVRAGELAAANVDLQRTGAALRHTATQLAESNRELEQFAYIASHDLQAPLRTVASFSQLLERRHGHLLQGEAKEFFGFITSGIRHMHTLIGDLLRLSQVEARRLEPKAVDAGDIVKQSCELLAADINAAGAKIHAGALPQLVADPRMLTQLFQNLLGNAIKFQKPGVMPEVWITAVVEDEFWRFSVRDNGIGIEPRFLEHIFQMFKRLHTPDEYAGTGIGLAICKKVVQVHGGEIWAESVAGQGTTMHFTLARESGYGEAGTTA